MGSRPELVCAAYPRALDAATGRFVPVGATTRETRTVRFRPFRQPAR